MELPRRLFGLADQVTPVTVFAFCIGCYPGESSQYTAGLAHEHAGLIRSAQPTGVSLPAGRYVKG